MQVSTDKLHMSSFRRISEKGHVDRAVCPGAPSGDSCLYFLPPPALLIGCTRQAGRVSLPYATQTADRVYAKSFSFSTTFRLVHFLSVCPVLRSTWRRIYLQIILSYRGCFLSVTFPQPKHIRLNMQVEYKYMSMQVVVAPTWMTSGPRLLVFVINKKSDVVVNGVHESLGVIKTSGDGHTSGGWSVVIFPTLYIAE